MEGHCEESYFKLCLNYNFVSPLAMLAAAVYTYLYVNCETTGSNRITLFGSFEWT